MGIQGGAKLNQHLRSMARRIGQGGTLRVGFIDGARYPSTDKATRLRKGVARLNAVGPRNPRNRTFIGPRQPSSAPTLFVATVAFWNNFGTATAPARPFFSNMIQEDSPKWGAALGRIVVHAQYDTKLALSQMGEGIQDKLVRRIVDWPADNAPLTVAIKGFNKGLVDLGIMQRHVGFEVTK
jgi:hypothetical protein